MKKPKEIIVFDEYQYSVQLKAFEKKLGLEKIIKAEVQKLIGGFEFETKDLFPNPETKIFDLIEKAFSNQNPMGLSGIKLAELKELKVSSLLNNEIFDYGKRIHITKPTKDSHTFYARTDKELERLANCKQFINAHKSFLNEGQILNRAIADQLYHSSNGAVTLGLNSELIPNINYVKDVV
jgi:hypothetical protein